MKKIKIVILIVALLIILGAIFVILDSPEKEKNYFSVEYEKNKKINLNELNKGNVYKNTIVVTNKGEEELYYSVKWVNVKNTYIMQNKLLYEVDTNDEGASYVGKSQLPVSSAPLFNKIKLSKGESHKYFLTIDYNGDIKKEKGKSFEGILEFVQIK